MAAPLRSIEELQKLRVVDLRKELSSLALPTTGKKDELVHRLYDHLASQVADNDSASTESPEAESPEGSGEEIPETSVDAGAERMETGDDPMMDEDTRSTDSQPEIAAPPEEQPAASQQETEAATAEVTESAMESQSPAQPEVQQEKESEQIMILVEQQQALLQQQKSAHDARQREVRKLQDQRQQLETALRQNSELLQQHQGNKSAIDQLQQQRNQLLAQGEAIASMQSAFSEEISTYQDQQHLNEQLIRQVMEREQLKEAEQQRMLLEKQQKLLAEQQAAQQTMQQALLQQQKKAEIIQQQQLSLLDQHSKQEEAMKQMLEQQRERQRQQEEAEQRRKQEEEERKAKEAAELKKKEAEAAAAATAAAAAAAAAASEAASLPSAETEPQSEDAEEDEADANKKLPKALEDMLSYKHVRAKQVGVEDIEHALVESHSTVSTQPLVQGQLPLGDVNEYDDDDDELSKQESQARQSKNKKRKMKKKSRAARKAQLKEVAKQEGEDKKMVDENTDDSGIEVEYVQEKPALDATDPLYNQFHKIFEAFKIDETSEQGGGKSELKDGEKLEKLTINENGVITKRGATHFGELEQDEEKVEKKDKISKKQMKKMNRMSVAQLKTVVTRPDLVEMHDVTAPDPKLLLSLKATRNSVPVPRHWCNKRKYLQGKRGFEKPPFELPDYIKATGITEMRQALADKEEAKSLKQKMREKSRPKMGKIDIDYQKLHDAFFKFQRKPRMTYHGDLYYEGKEFETRLKEKKPGNLSDDLRTALGMPIGSGAEKFPPPWLIAMQRYGPPPSYPNLKIPGLNAPIPDSCSFGYHAGGWGKPPVDEYGKPLYGDVFGQNLETHSEPIYDDTVDKGRWGEMESESEEESESESEEERDEDEIATGLVTPADPGMITPSGMTSIPTGMETPDAIELRKRIEDAMDAGGGDTPALYQVLPEKRTSVGAAMMGSSHTYDIAGAKKLTAEGIEVTLNPEELDLDTQAMQAKYDQTVREQQADIAKEDFSDMVAEHSAKAAKKRKKQQSSDKGSKKHKEFKF